MAVWVVFFGAMTRVGATDGMHRGDSLPFWEQACADNRPQACAAPAAGSRPRTAATTPGWACNELGPPLRRGPSGRRRPRSRAGLLLAGVRSAVSGRLCQPARSERAQPGQSTRARSPIAAARRRTKPHRHARAGAVRARVPSRLELRVRQTVGVAMSRRVRWLSATSSLAMPPRRLRIAGPPCPREGGVASMTRCPTLSRFRPARS